MQSGQDTESISMVQKYSRFRESVIMAVVKNMYN